MDFLMKDYLYLNRDFLVSFIAQQNRDAVMKNYSYLNNDLLSSFITNQETEAKKADPSQESKTDEILNEILNTSKLGNPQSDPAYELVSQIKTKTLLIDMLDSFIAYVQSSSEPFVTEMSKERVGRYVNIRTYFDFVSLSRIEALTSEELLEFYPRIKASESSITYLKDLHDKLFYIKTLFPYDIFLTAKGAIVLMEEKFMLVSRNQIGYKFRSKNISLVGIINKYASEVREESAKINQMLDEIQILALTLLRTLGIIREDETNVFLLTPIAIYI